MSAHRPTALITGASEGIGATYADRLAKRGSDLVLVARNAARLQSLADRLKLEQGVEVEVLPADLTNPADLERVQARLREDSPIELLVNNAGVATPGGFAGTTPDQLTQLLQLNVVALTQLTAAVTDRFSAAGRGAIVNIGSAIGLAPEMPFGAYGATKAYVLALSQALQVEFGPKGVYVQAVLPAATRTEIWGKSGLDVNAIPGVMEVGDLVDAALVGFDRREPVTIPPLPDDAQWKALEAARQAMLPNFRQSRPAARYQSVASATANASAPPPTDHSYG